MQYISILQLILYFSSEVFQARCILQFIKCKLFVESVLLLATIVFILLREY